MARSSNFRKRLAPEGFWWKNRREIARLARAGRSRGLFQPGSGVKPPLLVGRRRAIEALMDLAGSLASDQEPAMGAVIYGPRGTGKTGLLDVAVEAAKAEGIDRLHLDGQEIVSPEELTRLLLGGEAWPVEKSRASDHRVTSSLLGSSHRRDTRSRVGDPRTVGALRTLAGRKGCVVMVDEAHMMDAQAGGRLLAAVQAARRDATPVAVVLAGTPDLLHNIGNMGASFFLTRMDPNLQISSGLVPPHDAEAGVLLPLSAAGIEAEAAWQERIADLTQGYPYFIQALGRAIAEAYEDRPGEAADPSRNQAALDAFEARVDRHYQTVWVDLHEDNLAACAVQIGHLSDACSARNVPVPEAALNKAIELGVQHPLRRQDTVPDFHEAWLRMAHFGLLWTPELGGPLTVGIPSFFSFAAKKTEELTMREREALWQDRSDVLAVAGLSPEAQRVCP